MPKTFGDSSTAIGETIASTASRNSNSFRRSMLASVPWWGIAALTLLAVPTSQAALLTVIESRTGPDIVIPRFDGQSGRLQSVQLEVTMLSGSSSESGAHSHPATAIVSNNTIPTNSVEPLPSFTVESSPHAGHMHSFATPEYAASGINLGRFEAITLSSGPHVHTVRYGFPQLERVGTQFAWRVRIFVTPLVAEGHTHNFESMTKHYFFAGGDAEPFVGSADLVIPAGELVVAPGGVHAHSVPAQTVTFETAVGPRQVYFRGKSLLQSLPHEHTIDPNFHVTATFDYLPVPEPTGVPAVVLVSIVMFWHRLPQKFRR